MAAASIDDYVARFSTPGIDHYSDGTIVADGECYALVWSPAGQPFGGFNADGTAARPCDRVVLAGALAKTGRCPDSLFQVPAATYAELQGGEWAVCLVDTRRLGGAPAGVANGLPRRVNRWGLVGASVKVEPASSACLPAAAQQRALSAVSPTSGSSGVRAARLSSVPASTPAPRITAMEVVDGVVRLTVADTVDYLTYGIASGMTPVALADDLGSTIADGGEGELIQLEAAATGASRFFKITRAE